MVRGGIVQQSQQHCLTKFPLDREIGDRLPDTVMVVGSVLPAEVLVSSRSK